MKRWLFALLLSLAAAPAGAQQVQSYETPGNLKPTHDLACIGMDKVRNDYTPADLMVAYVKCTRAGRYDDALVLMLVAGTYARFDTLRVSDVSAHDAFQAIEADIPRDEKVVAGMQPVFEKDKAANSPELAKFCTDLKHLGAPNYYPAYMIAHGMGAFLGGGGLVKDFDAKKGWKTAVDQYMHCDVSDL